jgi:16S rRNA (cytosine967-C5)-methyltransferase
MKTRRKTEREITLDILTDIFENGAYNNIALSKHLSAAPPEQRPLITRLVNGVIRKHTYLDGIIEGFSTTKPTKLRPIVLNVLRLSVYQLLFMDKTPDYAVCNEASFILKKRKMHGLVGFTNGLLRNIVRNIGSLPKPQNTYPEWFVSRLAAQYGAETAAEILKTFDTPPDVTIRVNTIKTTAAALKARLQAEGVTAAAAHFCGDYLHVTKTRDLGMLPSFKDGLFFVQDESASLPITLVDPKPNGRILDLCAAPGGKSFAMAIQTDNRAVITACDIHPHKIRLITQGAARLGLACIDAQLSDARVFNPEYETAYDTVLLDAPCSGLGLLRKKPDIILNKTESHITQLAALQRQMLHTAWRYVKPGGTLVYSTCTLTPEENEQNALSLADTPLRLVEMRTILPSDYGTDGFFAAKFIRQNGE